MHFTGCAFTLNMNFHTKLHVYESCLIRELHKKSSNLSRYNAVKDEKLESSFHPHLAISDQALAHSWPQIASNVLNVKSKVCQTAIVVQCTVQILYTTF